MKKIKIDKQLLQKSSEQVEQEVLDILADGVKENLIQLGITKSGTTNFENLICLYCHNTVPWDVFYNDVDTDVDTRRI